MATSSSIAVTDGPDIVVGSGPAGVAAATALLARGRRVLMLDGGKTLEPEAEARRAALAASDPSGWGPGVRDLWMAPQFDGPPGQARRYGSDFAMERGEDTFADLPDGIGLRSSRAAGGLSHLWGAAILPYRATDMAGWPVTEADLAAHYRAVAAILPVAGRRDDLADLFPALPMAGRTPLPYPPQAEALLARLAAARDRLAAHGLTAGAARQAVAGGCRLCGLCLHGCPYGLIWKATDQIARLRESPAFGYRPGGTVTRFEETGSGVTLHLTGGDTLRAPRVFLGAGVLETARILLASAPGAASLTLRDSQHAFLPMLHRWRNRARPDRGRFHTLPQVFLELDAPEVSPFLVHAQVYSWNEFYARDLIRNYAGKLPGAAPVLTALARRLMVAQIFLHSDHSHRIGLTLAPDGRLRAALDANPDTVRTVRAAAARIGRAMGHAGLTALRMATRAGAPGSSFHVGASLPMTTAPHGAQSDPLGRPSGLSRLHVIDATVLPAVPATTITFPVMANAHRIASLAG